MMKRIHTINLVMIGILAVAVSAGAQGMMGVIQHAEQSAPGTVAVAMLSPVRALDAWGRIAVAEETTSSGVQRGADDSQEFEARAAGLEPGTQYQIAVDGVLAGVVTAGSMGYAEPVMETADDENPLPETLQPVEDLRLVEWQVTDGTTVLSGSFSGTPNGGGEPGDGSGDGGPAGGMHSIYGVIVGLVDGGFQLQVGMAVLTVQVTDATEFEGFSSLDDLQVGAMVEVEGQLGGDVITAIRLSLTLGPRQTHIVQITGGEPPTTPTPTPTPSSTPSTPPFGVAYGEGSDNLDHFMTYVRDIGVRRTKVSFYWSRLEPQPGVYDFANLDEYLGQLQPGDQALLNVFSDGWCTNEEAEQSYKGATLLSCPYGATSCETSCATLYDEFITTLAAHVKANDHGGIKYWQRDTEPASPRHYPADKPAEYVAAQKIFYQAIKSVLPEAIVVGVNHNGAFTNGGEPSSEAFFAYFLQYAKDYFDVLDIRLYESEYTIFPRVDWFRQRMNQYGYDKPVISTEQGGPDPRTLHDQGVNVYDEFWTQVEEACAGSPDPWQCLIRWIGENFDEINPKLQVFLWPADEAQNAKHERMHCHDITQRNVLMLAAGVQAAWWWNLQSPEVHPIFGKMRLMTRDYEALPGYACYQRLVAELGNATAVEQVSLVNDSIYFFRVQKADASAPLYVVWHREAGLDPYDAEAAPAVNATLPVGFDPVRVTDVFGNQKVRAAPGGMLTLAISDTPLFLEAVVSERRCPDSEMYSAAILNQRHGCLSCSP